MLILGGVPSRELTLEEKTSSSKVPKDGDMLVPRRVRIIWYDMILCATSQKMLLYSIETILKIVCSIFLGGDVLLAVSVYVYTCLQETNVSQQAREIHRLKNADWEGGDTCDTSQEGTNQGIECTNQYWCNTHECTNHNIFLREYDTIYITLYDTICI